jgi:hypothetical protein
MVQMSGYDVPGLVLNRILSTSSCVNRSLVSWCDRRVRRAQALMRGDRLRVLQRAAIGEIGRNPGRREAVVADGFGATAHHAPSPWAEEPTFLVIGDAARRVMDPRLLCESPFTDIDPLGVAFLFEESEIFEPCRGERRHKAA